MSDWKEIKLQDIANVKGRVGWKGYTVKDLRDNGALAIGAGQIDNQNKLDLTKAVYLSDEKYNESPEIMIDEGDLLIVQRGSLGKLVLIDKSIGRATINPSMVILKNISINKKFLYYYFCSHNGQKLISNSASQTGVPMISQEQILNFKILLPGSKTEQTRIAQILTTTDAVIEKTQAAIAKYKAIKQGMLHDLFTRGIDPATNKLRPSYQQAPELYKESELGWIPKEWEEKDFGKEVDLIHGHQFRDYDFTEFGVPVIKIGQVKPENVDLTNCSYVNYGREEEFKNEIIKNGDVLMALTGATLGKACLVKGLNGIVYQNYRVGRFEPIIRENDIDKEFLYYLLIAGELLAQIFNKVNTGAQGNIGKADFEKATFKKPPFDEQIKIAELLQTIENKIQSEQAYLQKLQQIKRGLMEDLLNGKKRVNIENETEQ